MTNRLITRLLALALLPMGGCWSYRPGSPDRLEASPVQIPEDAWPVRDIQKLEPIRQATPEWIYSQCVPDAKADLSGLSEDELKPLQVPSYVVEHNGIHGRGLIRIYRKAKTGDETADLLNSLITHLYTGFEPNASYISSRTLSSDYETYKNRVRAAYDEMNNSLRQKGKPYEYTTTENELLLTSGIDMHFPPFAVSTPRGIILHLQSFAGNDFEPQVLDVMRSRGWAVIDVKTTTEITTPVPECDKPRIAALEEVIARVDREYMERDLPLEKGPRSNRELLADPILRRRAPFAAELSRLRYGSYQVVCDEDIDTVAKQLGENIDQTLAGNAYAVEAALDYVQHDRPDLAKGPVVVMGFSAGALATPAAVALIRDRVNAVVMVGGGANLVHIARTSEFSDGGVTLRCGADKISEEVGRRLDERYLAYTRLDPYYTAPAMLGLPVLLVDASMDTWVATAGGDLLYERMERPDRLRIHLAGHMMLFYFLPDQGERIADWVERAISR